MKLFQVELALSGGEDHDYLVWANSPEEAVRHLMADQEYENDDFRHSPWASEIDVSNVPETPRLLGFKNTQRIVVEDR